MQLIADNALKMTSPDAAVYYQTWKRHALIQIKLRNRLTEANMQKLVHVSSALTLHKKQNQELTNRIADLSTVNFNVIHGCEDSTQMDEADSLLLMELIDSGQFDAGDLETSCDEIVQDGE